METLFRLCQWTGGVLVAAMGITVLAFTAFGLLACAFWAAGRVLDRLMAGRANGNHMPEERGH